MGVTDENPTPADEPTESERPAGGVLDPAPGNSAPQRDSELVLIFLLALLFRVVLVTVRRASWLDGGGFVHYGLRIASGLGFGPSSLLPPVYPYFLAVLYHIYGYALQPVLLTQAVAGALCVVPVWLTARSLGWGRSRAGLAAFLLGIAPLAAVEARHTTPPVLLASVFTLAVLLWVRSEPSWSDTVWVGLLLGVCVLGRPGLLVPAIFLVISRRKEKLVDGAIPSARLDARRGKAPATLPPGPFYLRHLAVAVLVCLVVFPWILRNTHLHRRPTLVDSTWALRLCAVTVPGSPPARLRLPARDARAPDNLVLTDNALAYDEVLAFAAARPGQLLQEWLRNLGRFFSPLRLADGSWADRYPYDHPWFRLLSGLGVGVLFLFVAAWVVLSRPITGREKSLAWTVTGFMLMGTVSGCPADARFFALPALALLGARGAGALRRTADAWRHGSRSNRAAC
jgi:hypothetical protein